MKMSLCFQHPILDVAPVDEEGSDAEPDPEAVQRYSRVCVCVCVCWEPRVSDTLNTAALL